MLGSRTAPMRALFCGLETYSIIGGIQKFNRRIIRHLANFSQLGRIAPLHVFLMRDNLNDCPELPGASFIYAGSNRLRFAVSLLAEVTSAQFLLLGHINLLPLGWLARLIRPDLPVVLFVHGDEAWNIPGYRRARFYEPAMARTLTRIASVSNYTAAHMARGFQLPIEKFSLFPNAVDPVAVEAGPKGTEPLLLTVTRLWAHDREKNLDKVLRAFGRLQTSVPDARYEIIGDGALRPELEALARELGVADRVRFLGRVDDDALRQAYERASVFVLPSSKEGFGIVYLEAWQHGLPVICGTEGASCEIVADGLDGFVVDPNNVDLLAERMRFLLSDRLAARQAGARGREKVEHNYLDKAFEGHLLNLLSVVSVT